MIQQLIYRGTPEGYRAVAMTAGLRGKGLVRTLVNLSRLPADYCGDAAIYSRTALENGVALMATAVDRYSTRNHHISHICYVPLEDLEGRTGCVLPPGSFMLEYPQTRGIDTLDEIAPIRKTELTTEEAHAAGILFPGGKGFASFLAGLNAVSSDVPSRRIKGLCVLSPLDAPLLSSMAYMLMETILTLVPEWAAHGLGYRSLWTAAENNARYPLFFAPEEARMDTDSLMSAGYTVIDAARGTVVCPKGDIPGPDSAVSAFSGALSDGDSASILTYAAELRAVLASPRSDSSAVAAKSPALKNPDAVKKAHPASCGSVQPERMPQRAGLQSEDADPGERQRDRLALAEKQARETEQRERMLRQQDMELCSEIRTRLSRDAAPVDDGRDDGAIPEASAEALFRLAADEVEERQGHDYAWRRHYISGESERFVRRADRVRMMSEFISMARRRYEQIPDDDPARTILAEWTLIVAEDDDLLSPKTVKSYVMGRPMGMMAARCIEDILLQETARLSPDYCQIMRSWTVKEAVFRAGDTDAKEKDRMMWAIRDIWAMNKKQREQIRAWLDKMASSCAPDPDLTRVCAMSALLSGVRLKEDNLNVLILPKMACIEQIETGHDRQQFSRLYDKMAAYAKKYWQV